MICFFGAREKPSFYHPFVEDDCGESPTLSRPDRHILRSTWSVSLAVRIEYPKTPKDLRISRTFQTCLNRWEDHSLWFTLDRL